MLSTFYILTHFTLTATLGIKYDEQHITLTLYTLHTNERAGNTELHQLSKTTQLVNGGTCISHRSSQVPEPILLGMGTQILGTLKQVEFLVVLPK